MMEKWKAVLACLVLVGVSGFLQADVTLVNGDFETGDLTNWYNYGGSQAIVTDGSYAMEVTAPSGAVATVQNGWYFPTPGDVYVIECDLKLVSGTDRWADAQVYLRYLNADATAVLDQTFLHSGSQDGTWNHIVGTPLEVPVGTGYMDIVVYTNMTGSTTDIGIFRFDNFVLTKISQVDLEDGLLAGWSMDQTFGSTAYDYTGNYDASVYVRDSSTAYIADAWETDGKFGGCLSGSQSDNSANSWIRAEAELTGFSASATNGLSVSAWFKLAPGFSPSAQPYYMLNCGGSWGSRMIWAEFQPGGSTLNRIAAQPASDILWSWGPVNDNQWHNLIMVWDGSVVEWFLDGVSVGSKSHTYGFPFSLFQMAGVSPDAGGIGFDGKVDDIGIWDRVLNAEEIAYLQNNPIMPPPPQPPTPISPTYDAFVGPDGSLVWEAGPSGPFDSYNVYFSDNVDDVINDDCDSLYGDVDGNCDVNMDDLQLIADCWLETASAGCFIAADIAPSDRVDLGDFSELAYDWGMTGGGPSFKGNQTGLSYPYSGLADGMKYWRIDGLKNNEITKGTVMQFYVASPWQQTEFVNMMGWTELEQFQDSYRTPYAQDLYNMGIRHAMDRGYAMTEYFYPNGIDVFLYYNPTGDQYAYQYRTTDGNAGYFQFDEPGQSEWPNVATYHNACRTADPSRPSYTNLKSSHAISNWDPYVQNYIDTVNPHMLSYDCYPYRYGFNNHWKSLEIARTKALAAGIPLWNWQETNQGSMDSYVGDTVNRNRLRTVCYSSLAYGVKGISWFNILMCFDIQPNQDPPTYTQRTYSFGPAYDDVAEVNAEINRLGDVLVNLRSTAVYHKNSPSSYCTELPGGFWIQLSGSNQILGMFIDDDTSQEYAMVCNRSDSGGITTTVTFSSTVNAIEVLNEQNGNWENLTISGSPGSQSVQIYMGPGYGKLLRITQP